jgi:hypothetical protein
MIRDGRLTGQTPRGRTHTSVFLSARALTIACLSGCPISRRKLAVQHIFCPSGHSSVCQTKCLRLSCLSVHPSVKPVRPTVHLCLCVCLSVCLSVCMSVRLSVCLSACLLAHVRMSLRLLAKIKANMASSMLASSTTIMAATVSTRPLAGGTV